MAQPKTYVLRIVIVEEKTDAEPEQECFCATFGSTDRNSLILPGTQDFSLDGALAYIEEKTDTGGRK